MNNDTNRVTIFFVLVVILMLEKDSVNINEPMVIKSAICLTDDKARNKSPNIRNKFLILNFLLKNKKNKNIINMYRRKHGLLYKTVG